jgi:NAD-dependent SIR2 family protein deacetylase
VDNLHLKSGISPGLLAELHGNMTKLRCGGCGNTVDRSVGQTRCECGGELRDSVVNFGESLPEKDLMLSFEHSRKSDLFMVVGSSLVVTPAADMPGETPFDQFAHLRFHEKMGEVLPKAVKRLKRLM